jgi:hypothetical protein
MQTTFIFSSLAAVLLLVACGESKPPSTAASATSSSSSSSPARPTCDAIDEACDAHERAGGLAKECHDLGESTTTPEATCIARKAECLAACPAKAR